MKTLLSTNHDHDIADLFHEDAEVIVYPGDCLEFLKTIPEETVRLVVTSPSYNIGKSYESRLVLDDYLKQQREIIRECYRVLAPSGSICWEVGNFIDPAGGIIPLDSVLYPVFRSLGMKMRNRIVWQFGHGLHCKNRFSGRYETIVWYTKGDDYVFNLDPVRVPQKYPGKKHFKGPKAGEYSCNPLGKNPGDVWEIPNVKSNHVEKTDHPCQFPVELVERLVLSMSDEGDTVLDPFLGVGTTIIAAIRHKRKGFGAETVVDYVKTARQRIRMEIEGVLKTRPMDRPVYDPVKNGCKIALSPWQNHLRLQEASK